LNDSSAVSSARREKLSASLYVSPLPTFRELNKTLIVIIIIISATTTVLKIFAILVVVVVVVVVKRFY
jgi:hypothetical protein